MNNIQQRKEKKEGKTEVLISFKKCFYNTRPSCRTTTEKGREGKCRAGSRASNFNFSAMGVSAGYVEQKKEKRKSCKSSPSFTATVRVQDKEKIKKKKGTASPPFP